MCSHCYFGAASVGWHRRLNGHEFEWTLGTGDGHGGLVQCSPWGPKESGMTEWLNWIVASQSKPIVNCFIKKGEIQWYYLWKKGLHLFQEHHKLPQSHLTDLARNQRWTRLRPLGSMDEYGWWTWFEKKPKKKKKIITSILCCLSVPSVPGTQDYHPMW